MGDLAILKHRHLSKQVLCLLHTLFPYELRTVLLTPNWGPKDLEATCAVPLNLLRKHVEAARRSLASRGHKYALSEVKVQAYAWRSILEKLNGVQYSALVACNDYIV